MLSFAAGAALATFFSFVLMSGATKRTKTPKPYGPWHETNRCLGCDSAYPLGSVLRSGDPGYDFKITTRWVCKKCGAHSTDVIRRWLGREKPDGSYEWKHWSALPADIKPKVDPLEELAALGKL